MKNTETKANCCTVLNSYLEDSNQESWVWEVYKMVKLSMKEFKYFYQIRTSFLQSGCSWCYHWATDSVNIGSNTTVVKKTHVNVHWPGPPLSIRLLHNLREPPFSPKNKRRLFAFASISILILQYAFLQRDIYLPNQTLSPNTTTSLTQN